MFGARFSREVLGLSFALGLGLTLAEPLSRMILGAPGWIPAEPSAPKSAHRFAATTYDPRLRPYGIDRGLCDRNLLAADLSAGTAPAPSMLVGDVLGAKMDSVDQGCVNTVLEFAPDQHRVLWRNPLNGLTYTVVATQTYQNETGVYCRAYDTTSVIGGQPREVREQACRKGPGLWTAVR